MTFVGNTLYGLERYEEAIVAYDYATQLEPDYSTAFNNKGT